MIVVTGATGHIGNTLVRRLVEKGEQVRAFVPAGESTGHLAGLPIEFVRGDIRDQAALREAFRGAEAVFHLAGMVSILPGQSGLLHEINVLGTRNVVQACLAMGVGRLIYTSSVHAFEELPKGLIRQETLDFAPEKLMGRYAQSKAGATLEVLAGIKQGLDAVIVFPSGVIGPYDYKPSELGQMINDYRRGKLKAYVKGAYDFVDVRDVAEGLIAARERGKSGEGYILCGHWVTIRELMKLLQAATGRKPPGWCIPHWVGLTASFFMPLYYRLTKRVPRFTTYSLKVLVSNSLLKSDKACQELGYKPHSLHDTIFDTVAWFQEQGRQEPVFGRGDAMLFRRGRGNAGGI